MDSDLNYLDVCTGFYGNSVDSFVYKHSGWRQRVEEMRDQMLPRGAFLVGDAGYPLTPEVIVPFPAEPTTPIRRFNYAMSSQRMCVECGFGRQKALFPILSVQRSHGVEMTGHLALVCCVSLCNVHNQVNLVDGGPSLAQLLALERATQLSAPPGGSTATGGRGGGVTTRWRKRCWHARSWRAVTQG